jgi:hypothetical protein
MQAMFETALCLQRCECLRKVHQLSLWQSEMFRSRELRIEG